MLIISAGNVSISKDKSKSVSIANNLRIELLKFIKEEIEIIDLRDYEFDFCIMCEKCHKEQKCVQNDDFNVFFGQWNKHEDIIFVVPHYALIPSKLICCFEKIQEMYYLNYCLGKENNPSKRILIIAHGGMTANYKDIYTKNIIKPLSSIIENMGSIVVNDQINEPLCIGVKKYFGTKETNSICFKKEDDKESEDKVIGLVRAYYAHKPGLRENS
jgi:hypothetical protein